MFQFAGKVAFVTGAASGIGLGIAKALRNVGANVILADINLEGARKAADDLSSQGPGRAIAVKLDACDPESWREAADRAEAEFGKIHILCSNAGVGAGKGTIEERTIEDLDWVWNVNARGMFIGVKEMLPRIRKHGEDGHIVITSSVMGAFATPGVSLYSMSKYAAAALAETLYLELKGSNIGVSNLCPGVVNTDLLVNVHKNMPSQHGSTANEKTFSFLAAGADPLDIGTRVVEGIRDGDFYIFTHPEYRGLIEERFNLILSSFSRRASPGAEDDLSFYQVRYGS